MSIEFEKVRIGDLGKVVTGKTPPTAREEYFGTDYPFITPTDIDGSKRHVETDRYLSRESKKDFNNYLLPSGAICFVCIGATIGKICMTNVPSFTNQQINGVIVDGKRYDNCFVYYLLSTKKEHIKNIAGGAATPIVSKSAFSDIFVEIPELIVQQKIATILSGYDDLIEDNLRRIKILEEMAQTLYREWFVKFRFPGHRKVKMVDSPLGKIPIGWEVKKATDAIAVNPTTKVPREGEKPFVSMGSLSNDSMLINGSELRSGNSGSKFINGDTLFARITPCLENGKTAYVQFLPSDSDVAFGSTEFIVLRSKTLCPELVYFMARSNEFRGNAIKSMSGASGRQRVQEACFDKYLFAHPDPKTVSMFAEQIAPIFRCVHTLSRKNDNLRRTRDLLLPKLISGELDVSELDIKQAPPP